jgi:hypothetical protein
LPLVAALLLLLLLLLLLPLACQAVRIARVLALCFQLHPTVLLVFVASIKALQILQYTLTLPNHHHAQTKWQTTHSRD